MKHAQSFRNTKGINRINKNIHPAAGKHRGPAETVRRGKTRAVLGALFGVFAVLLLTLAFALPQLFREPFAVEGVAAPEEHPERLAGNAAAQETPLPTPSPVPSPAPSPGYTQLDDWQLVLVNAEVELPEDFSVQTRLYGDVEVNRLIYTPLTEMLDAMYRDGITVWLASGYRSVETQEVILQRAVENRMASGMTREEAERDALRTIQQPRHSEHHTGLAVDFNNVADDFHETDAYTWLLENAAAYGFVERYPEDKADITGIDYEPWHFRYVGKEHAAAMQSLGMCLEEYCMYVQGA